MKKYVVGILAMAFIISLSAFTVQTTAKNAEQKENVTKKLTQLIWYYDSGKSAPVGSTAEPADEVSRLQAENPGYTFSLSSAPGLHVVEYGFISQNATNFSERIFTNMP